MTPARKRRTLEVCALTLAVCASLPARAESPSEARAQADALFAGKWRVDPDNPQLGIPTEQERNAHPVDFAYFLMNLSESAELAIERKDHATAVKYYLALARAVPDMSVPFAKLCQSYQALGKLDDAEKSCRAALERQNVAVGDFVRYVQVVLARPDPLRPEHIEQLDAVIAHVKAQPDREGLAAELECQVGMRLSDERRLRACTQVLEVRTPRLATKNNKSRP